MVKANTTSDLQLSGFLSLVGKHKHHMVFALSFLMGLLIVYSFGFKPTRIRPLETLLCNVFSSGSPDTIRYWEHWELGALAWSAITSVLFYVTVKLPAKQALGKLVSFIFLVPVVASHGFAASSVFKCNHHAHIWSIFAIGFAFLVIDTILSAFHDDRRERFESKQALLIADIPIVVAFTVFLVYQELHAEEDNLAAFLGGAISFQLVASTFVFAFIKAGYLGRLSAQNFRADQHHGPDVVPAPPADKASV